LDGVLREGRRMVEERREQDGPSQRIVGDRRLVIETLMSDSVSNQAVNSILMSWIQRDSVERFVCESAKTMHIDASKSGRHL
jgi:hypothetical protein